MKCQVLYVRTVHQKVPLLSRHYGLPQTGSAGPLRCCLAAHARKVPSDSYRNLHPSYDDADHKYRFHMIRSKRLPRLPCRAQSSLYNAALVGSNIAQTSHCSLPMPSKHLTDYFGTPAPRQWHYALSQVLPARTCECRLRGI